MVTVRRCEGRALVDPLLSARTLTWLGVLLLIGASALVPGVLPGSATGTAFGGLFVADSFAAFAKLVIYAGAAIAMLMAMSWLPRVLAAFEAANPSIRIDLLMEGTQRKADPDLAIRFGEEPHLVRHPTWLMGMSHVVMCRKEDLTRIASLDDLLSFRLYDVASHAIGWTALLNHNFGHQPGRQLKIETVDTTPLSLMMVSQGLGLAIGHLPVCGPIAASLGLVVCPFVPKTPGPGNYYLEQSQDRPQRASVRRLMQALQEAAHSSMRTI